MGIRVLENRRVLLGVTGGIAAYKSASIASMLVKGGALVDVVMTGAATQFVAPLTFRAITHRPVYADIFEIPHGSNIPHVTLGAEADLIVIAPITAATLAKLAAGLADNLLVASVMASSAPRLLAPAMESHMWEYPATRQNVETLRGWGAHVVGPAGGRLASGASGVGRMAEPEEVVEAARFVLGRGGDFAGRKVVVSAGGTREPIDPVRFVGNHSSGKMGYAIARAARDRGADVVLVSGPTCLVPPYGVQTAHVGTAQQMLEAVLAHVEGADALIMAAAVADFRPSSAAAQKIKKAEKAEKPGGEGRTLELVRTPDVLAHVADLREKGGGPKVVVGFAAETESLLANAAEKLEKKRLDLIAANDLTEPGSGFGSNTNRVTLLYREGDAEELPLVDKEEAGHIILDRVLRLLSKAGRA